MPEYPDIARHIDRSWSEERCNWSVEYVASYWTEDPNPWLVSLEWTSEYENPHHADFVTYTWQFWGGTAIEAMGDAAKWLDELAPWRRCGACDGVGRYSTVDPCDSCGGSGLESEADA